MKKKPKIKFVKKANCWCKTSWIGEKQIQEWSIKPFNQTICIKE